MNYWNQSRQNIYVSAHRGYSEVYPENTMAAFRAALDLGVDQIETDIRVTKDGELVIMHDAAVDRTTSGSGAVESYTLAELKQLDAGIKKGERFAGERIPTLVEFMELIKDVPGLTVNFELKEYPTAGREALAFDVCDRVLRTIDDYAYTDRCVVNTFSAKLHEYIYKKHGKKYKLHVYFPHSHMGECLIPPYEYAYSCCMYAEKGSDSIMASKASCDAAWKQGVEPWGPTSIVDAAGVDLAIQNGVSLITCNDPKKILTLLQERGYHGESQSKGVSIGA